MSGASSPASVTLFQQESGGVTYRIPALLYIPHPSIFLAFAEKRSSPNDQDAMYLVMRRGTVEHGGVQWEDMIAVRHAKLPGHRTMNPCPLYNPATKTIFLFFICVKTACSERCQILTGRNAARLCYVTSHDLGKSWSLTKDVTEEVLGRDMKNCATLAVGPGHGVCSPSGRLIVPAYLYYIHSRVCSLPLPWKTKPHSFIFYSDDHGESWHKGSGLWKQETSECEVAQVACSNGSDLLYCSARTSRHYRVEATSVSQSMEFGDAQFNKSLCEPPHGCQGSVVSYEPMEVHQEEDEADGRDESGKSCLKIRASSWLLYSHPTSSHRRVDLGIYLNKSPLVPSSWARPWVINEGPSGYSDLAVCQDAHTFACLFEGGKDACEKITFRRFTVEELLNNSSKP
ncbi:sialidase-3-like [Bufo bufo]|uniref:sialidase-3-like n=1 Tax=Bufo bufo TaxID=8384 RepID=UPI001ABE0F09|nr:sialidase-3-like [Bufo bufo]XP_040282465.1 sialidase-3-like [Bufo bufo]XP_040282466.1 sialidase-3-like [Bufo bufo]XP_040282468.1 sialidase-3-like [Bufo bufo]XP_040282469.1 sialidase-3-like [Bufo bufo]XP_040282470.1 sialidase-3-like [Bufo bufo]XP_040282471.1 sialidase-3-like [Bufo bufo]XP_040282472.1 sialidase-3-like [Bufo bufo]XP_040282473.1 sialidase-3-like [Bufo bufo]XP_040282474.1 sialidase-3-like [Bufo bufo]XP_040282475.1 sialidase-3-like [Bufo bufo]